MMTMIRAEAVNWLINIMSDIGKSQHRDLWHYEQALAEIKKMLEEEPHWIPCSITTNLPDHEVLCCDLRGNMLIGYLYTDEGSDTGFGAESDGECLVDCVAWREKPEPWYER